MSFGARFGFLLVQISVGDRQQTHQNKERTMNKRGFLLVLLLAVVVSTTVIAEDSYVVVPVNISLVPMISFGQAAGSKTINIVQLNVVAGYADVLRGAALGVVSIIGEDAEGVQAGVANWVSGDLTGVQAGVVNTVLGTADGAQAGVLNYAKSTPFAQAGVVNISKSARGVQLGVINIAEENEGIPIGVVNVVLKNGQTHAQSWYDEMGLMNLALIHGTKTVYNIYTVGMDSKFKDVTAGLGMGVHIPLDKAFLNVEGIYSVVSPRDAIAVEYESLFRARVYLGYNFSFFSLIGGVSFNYLSNTNATSITLAPVHGYEFGFSSKEHRFWPGVFVGVQF
jgi:hypothetical protein